MSINWEFQLSSYYYKNNSGKNQNCYLYSLAAKTYYFQYFFKSRIKFRAQFSKLLYSIFKYTKNLLSKAKCEERHVGQYTKQKNIQLSVNSNTGA